MKAVMLSPAYPPEMQQFTRGLAEVGADVYGVGDAPLAALPESLRGHLAGYLQVPALLDEQDVMDRVSAWLHGQRIDRVLANWEPLVLLAARLRERWGLGGMSPDTVLGFRDKALMKERVRAAGLRVPRSERARTVAELHEAAERVGYPLVVKPIAGAGSADTYRVDSAPELSAIAPRLARVPEVAVEEFIAGREFTFDAITIAGEVVAESVMEYFPKPLEARSEEWISPGQITVRDLGQPHLLGGRALGRDVLAALGMGSGFAHLEWYLTPDGEAVFGEVGCRSGGGRIVDQMNYACDTDHFTEWARAVCHGRFEGRTERRYNVAGVFKRAQGQGRITRIEGLTDFMALHGNHVVDEALSRPGTPRRDWRQTLISDGWLTMRHPDWDRTLHLMREATTRVHLFAG